MRQVLKPFMALVPGALLLIQTACMNGSDHQLGFSDHTAKGNQDSMHLSHADELYRATVKDNKVTLKYLVSVSKPDSYSELAKKLRIEENLSDEKKDKIILKTSEAIAESTLTEEQKVEAFAELLVKNNGLGIKEQIEGLAEQIERILNIESATDNIKNDVKRVLKVGLYSLRTEGVVKTLFYVMMDTLADECAFDKKAEDLKIVLQASLPADLDLFPEAAIRAIESVLKAQLPAEQEKENLQILTVSIWKHDDNTSQKALQFILNEVINDLDKGRLNKKKAATIAQAILDNKTLSKKQGRFLLKRLKNYGKSFSEKQHQTIQKRLAEAPRRQWNRKLI